MYQIYSSYFTFPPFTEIVTDRRTKQQTDMRVQIPRGIEINELDVGESDSGDDAEHDAEDAPDDWRRDGQEQGTKLRKEKALIISLIIS